MFAITNLSIVEKNRKRGFVNYKECFRLETESKTKCKIELKVSIQIYILYILYIYIFTWIEIVVLGSSFNVEISRDSVDKEKSTHQTPRVVISLLLDSLNVHGLR